MTSHDTFGLVTGSSRIFSSEPPVSLIKKNKIEHACAKDRRN